MEDKNVFKIRAVEIKEYEGWGTPSVNTYEVHLDFKSVEDCKKVIEIADLKNWEIFSGKECFDEKVIERSKRYQEILVQEKIKKIERDELKKKQVEVINSLPKLFEFKYDLPVGLKIWFEKTPAEYKPGYSSKIQWGLHCHYSAKGNRFSEETPRDIWISDYLSDNKRVLHKKFAKEVNEWKKFGDEIGKLINPEDLIRAIIATHQNLEKYVQEKIDAVKI